MITSKNFEKNTQHTELLTASPLYDLGMVEEMDDTEYLVEVVSLFIEGTPKELKEMRDALRAGNTEIIYKTAHKLKSSAGVIQANALTEVLNGIEAIAKSGTLNAELDSLIENAMCQYKDIEQALKKHLKELG